MMDESTPIAYTALMPGTPVQSVDGAQFGTVEKVLAVEDLDVFDGLTVSTDDGLRFVDADQAGTITTDYVRTTLTPEQARALPEPAAAPSYRVDASDDTGSSIGDRIGRMLGRGKWREQR